MDFEKWDLKLGQEKALKEAHIQDLSLKANSSAELKHALERQLKSTDPNLKKLQHDSVQLQHEMVAACQDLRAANQALQSFLDDIRQENNTPQHARMQKQHEQEKQVVKLRQEEKVLQEQASNYHAIAQYLEQQLEDAKHRTQTVKKGVEDAKQKIEQLQASHGNPASILTANSRTILGIGVSMTRCISCEGCIILRLEKFSQRSFHSPMFVGAEDEPAGSLESAAPWCHRLLHEECNAAYAWLRRNRIFGGLQAGADSAQASIQRGQVARGET